MFLKIPRLYDSHTHFLATGEWALGLKLGSLQNAHEVEKLATKPEHFRGSWLVGSGWNPQAWPKDLDLKTILDKTFPNFPVCFIRMDGHSCWVNSQALKALGVSSETGVLTELEHFAAMAKIPSYSKEQEEFQILTACKIFNRAGFTHIRDLTCSESLWDLLVGMEERNLLTLAVEENFTASNANDVERALKECLYARSHETALLRSKGIKIFFDGSLGSETAFLSKPYGGDPARGCGRPLWDLQDVADVLRKSWEQKLEVSVHAIGDEAAHQIVKCARDLSAKGFVGRLNLEHIQMARPETIQMMKPLHVRCHMQPCHWLSDRVWLKEKLGELYKYVFPWEALRAAQMPLSFGCDSPIEPPSFFNNERALRESAKEKIRKFTGDLSIVHAHPDSEFAPDSYTVIENEQIKEVIFRGKPLLLES